jgi:hypothetical protein
MHSSTAGGEAGNNCSTSHGSTWVGTSEASPRTACASALRRATRAITASRTVLGSASPGSARASVTKNGLPAVASKSQGRIAAGAFRKLPHRCFGQGLQGHMPHAACREIAQDERQRMRCSDLVAPIGEDEQRRNLQDATADELDQIKRRRVGPARPRTRGMLEVSRSASSSAEKRCAPGAPASMRSSSGPRS